MLRPTEFRPQPDDGLVLAVFPDPSQPPLPCGYLLDSPAHGIFDPTWGRVPVSSPDARRHNLNLDDLLITAIENARPGFRVVLYSGGHNHPVTTWPGCILSHRPHYTRTTITFTRAGRIFRGRIRRNTHTITFRCIGFADSTPPKGS